MLLGISYSITELYRVFCNNTIPFGIIAQATAVGINVVQL